MKNTFPYNEHGVLLGNYTIEEREAFIKKRIDSYLGDRTKRGQFSSGRKKSGKTMSPERRVRMYAVLKWNRKIKRELKREAKKADE